MAQTIAEGADPNHEHYHSRYMSMEEDGGTPAIIPEQLISSGNNNDNNKEMCTGIVRHENAYSVVGMPDCIAPKVLAA